IVPVTGGNDGLSTVIPLKDPQYGKLRPTLRQPTAQIHKLTDSLGLHPNMGSLAGLLEDQALCVVQGVGYPNPNQSHFRSMDIWQAASMANELNEGWIGRALKHVPAAGAFHMSGSNESAPLALTGAPARVPSIASIEDFQLHFAAASGADKKQQRAVIEGAAKSDTSKPGLLDFVQRTAANTYASSQRLQELGK